MRAWFFLGFALMATVGHVSAQEKGHPSLTQIELRCSKTNIAVGEPLSLEIEVTIQRAPGDEEPKSLGLFDPGFELVVQSQLPDSSWSDGKAKCFLPVSVWNGAEHSRLCSIDFGPAEKAKTVTIVLLGEKRRPEPSKPGPDVWRPYFDTAGTFRISLRSRKTGTASNQIVVAVEHDARMSAGALELFYRRELFSFLLQPRERLQRDGGMELAEQFLAEHSATSLTCYVQVGVGIARLQQARERSSGSEKTALLGEAARLLGLGADGLAQDNPFVQDALMTMGEASKLLGHTQEAIQVWQLLLDRYPQSPLVPQVRELLAKEAAPKTDK